MASIPRPQIIRMTSLHSVCSASSRISTSQRSTAVSLSFSLALPLKTDSNAYIPLVSAICQGDVLKQSSHLEKNLATESISSTCIRHRGVISVWGEGVILKEVVCFKDKCRICRFAGIENAQPKLYQSVRISYMSYFICIWKWSY